MSTAVITGPTGAIGTALIDELATHGYEVYAVCREKSTRMNCIPKHPLVHIVACDVQRIDNLLHLISAPCDVFFHFAWVGVYGNDRDNLFGQNENVRFTLQAVEVAKALGCHTFVGAGSQSEYGVTDMALTPNHPTFPESGYGVAKLSAGLFSRLRCQQLGMQGCRFGISSCCRKGEKWCNLCAWKWKLPSSLRIFCCRTGCNRSQTYIRFWRGTLLSAPSYTSGGGYLEPDSRYWLSTTVRI